MSDPTENGTASSGSKRRVPWGLLVLLPAGAVLLFVAYQYQRGTVERIQRESEEGENQQRAHVRRLERQRMDAFYSAQAKERARVKNGTSPKGNAGLGFEYRVTYTDMPDGRVQADVEIENLRDLEYVYALFSTWASDKDGQLLLRASSRLNRVHARVKRTHKYLIRGPSSQIGEFKVHCEETAQPPWPLDLRPY